MPGGENVLHQEAYKVQAVDTTAAGDTFTGYFLAQRMNGADVKQALAMASAASALAVSRKGAAPSIPEREEAERSLRIFQQESCEAELNAENSGGAEESGSVAERFLQRIPASVFHRDSHAAWFLRECRGAGEPGAGSV